MFYNYSRVMADIEYVTQFPLLSTSGSKNPKSVTGKLYGMRKDGFKSKLPGTVKCNLINSEELKATCKF